MIWTRIAKLCLPLVVFLLVLGPAVLRAQAPGLQAADTPTDVRMPLLMPDDFSDMHLVQWRVERGELDKKNNPLIEGATPWDGGGVGIHGSVFKDPIDGKWKAYLVGTPPKFHGVDPKRPWMSENHAYRVLCLYESDDGVNWMRPELNLHAYDEHKQTNILFSLKNGVAAYPSIFIDPKNKEWPYLMFVLREAWGHPGHGTPPQGNGFYRYRSKDGRKWEPLGKVKGPMTGDLGMVQRSLTGDGYICYYRLGGRRQPTDHVPVWEDTARRTVMRAVSRDGQKWEQDKAMILTGDERDHRDTQYQECVPTKVKGGYVGLITVYNPITQVFYLRMAASRDSRRWWYPDRVPCLDNPPLGDWGGGMIWQSQNLIVQDDRLYVYFGGCEGPHRQLIDSRAPAVDVNHQERIISQGAHFIPFNSALCRASWRFDRMYALVSAAGGPTVGAATTKARALAGGQLWVNVRTRGEKRPTPQRYNDGKLEVELLDADGNAIPGFAREDCRPIRGDHPEVQIKWKGGDVAPKDARQARFFLKRSFLYGFEFRGLRENAASKDTAASVKRPVPDPVEQIELRAYKWGGPYAEHRSKYACPHDDGLCVDVRVPWLEKGERLILRTSEIVGYDAAYFYDDHFPTQEQDGRGRGYKHTAFEWNTQKTPDELSASCKLPGKGQFSIRLKAAADYIDINMKIRNDTKRVMPWVDWYFCPVAFEAPSLLNRDLDRTYLFDGKRLVTLAETGDPSETMYLVTGDRGSAGFIPPLHAAHPASKTKARAPLVIVENRAGTHSLGLAFERAHSIFSSAGNGCYHADPFFGHQLKPGEERTVRGRLYLAAGKPQDLFKRFAADFPVGK